MNNAPLLYNLSDCILEFTYDNFSNIIEGAEIGPPMAALLQKHYWNFPYEDLVALVLSDEASYQEEILLVFTTGIFHGRSEDGGVFIRFNDVLNWNCTEDTLHVITSDHSYYIKTTNIDSLSSIAFFFDACRSEAARFSCNRAPRTGYKKPPLFRSERQLLKQIFKKTGQNRSVRKLATTSHEKELALRCLAGQSQRGLEEINHKLALFYELN